MRHRTLLVALLLLPSLLGLAASAGGSLVNGGFENGFQGWITTDSPSYHAVDCDTAYAGDCSLRLAHRSYGGHVGQDVPAGDAPMATLSFEFLNPQGGSMANKWFVAYLGFYDANRVPLRSVLVYENFDPITSWIHVQGETYELPAGTAWVRVGLNTGSGCGCMDEWHSWVDEVVLDLGTPTSLPGAPRDIAAFALARTTHVELTWTPPASDGGLPLTGYVVERSGEGSSSVGPTTRWVDSNLTGGETICYTVRAVNELGEGPDSGPACVTAFSPAGPPTNVTAAPGPGLGKLGVRWGPPEDVGGIPIQGYLVFDASDGMRVLADVGLNTTYVEDGLAPGTERCYAVAARTDTEGEMGPVACATTYSDEPPERVQRLAARPGADGTRVSWEAPFPNDGPPVFMYLVRVGEVCAVGVASFCEVDVIQTESLEILDSRAGRGLRQYVVTAVNEVGAGEYASVLTVHARRG